MYLLEAPDSAIPTLKSKLAPQGDSLVVVGGGGRWNVHIHVDDPGPAVEAGVTAGRPHRIKITNLVDPAHRGGSHRETRRAVVALASPPGLVTIFEETGAMVVQHDPDRPPGTSALLAAITATSAQQVVVIADAENTVAVADAAAAQARDDGVRVAVIPAGSCVQAIAALAVHEPAHDFDADVIAMSGAAGGARHAEVTIATSEAVTSAGLCRAGDVLGLIEGDVAQIGSDVAEVSVSILQRMLDAGGELVTLVTGAAAPANLGERLAGKLHTQRPEVECVVYDGGQADYPLLIGVE
jgi:dihydroxyacetone kinase-like predicted kinase